MAATYHEPDDSTRPRDLFMLGPVSHGRDLEVVIRRIEAFRREAAIEQIARLRREPGADGHAAFASRHAFVAGAEVREVLGEAKERGTLDPREVAAWAAHARAAARLRAVASVHDTLAAHAKRRVAGDPDGLHFVALVGALRTRPAREIEGYDGVVREAARARAAIAEARARAAEAEARFVTLVDGRPDALDPEDVRARARSLLDTTDDLLAEALDYLAHRLRDDVTPARLVRALGASDLDDAFRPDALRARVTALVEPMGLDGALAKRVRLEAPHGGAGFRAEIVYVDPPFDVRVSPSAHLGVLGEASLLEGLGRALATSLVAPAFAYAFRHPLEGTAPRAVGGLLVRLAFDRARLDRARRVPDHVQDASRRLVAITTLLALRVCATAAITSAGEPGDDLAVEALRRAIGLRVAPEIAGLVLGPTTHAARLVGGLSGLSLFARLRERFDEDFDRNPRAPEAIRGVCERGGSVSADGALEELGGQVAPAPLLAEWLRGR